MTYPPTPPTPPTPSSSIPIIPIVTAEPEPSEPTNQATNWAETQVLQSIKEASFRGKSAYRVLTGQASQPLGNRAVAAGAPEMGRLVTPKLRKRTRLRRFLSYLSA